MDLLYFTDATEPVPWKIVIEAYDKRGLGTETRPVFTDFFFGRHRH